MRLGARVPGPESFNLVACASQPSIDQFPRDNRALSRRQNQQHPLEFGTLALVDRHCIRGLVLRQPQGQEVPTSLFRSGEIRSQSFSGVRKQHADVAVEQAEVVVIARDQHRATGIKGRARISQAGFGQDLLHQPVKILHAVGAGPQGAEDAEMSKAPQGFRRPRSLQVRGVVVEHGGFQSRLQRRRLRRNLPDHLRAGSAGRFLQHVHRPVGIPVVDCPAQFVDPALLAKSVVLSQFDDAVSQVA